MKKSARFRILLTVIKLTVFLACVVIGIRYLQKHDPDWDKVSLDPVRLLVFPVLIAATYINWRLESMKWQHLVGTVARISSRKAFRATLSGVAVSFITPFRLGDFAGRIAHLQNNRKNASVLTFYGNYAQMVTTVFFGLLGGSVLVWYDPEILNFEITPLLMVIAWSAWLITLLVLLFPSSFLKFIRLETVLGVDLSISHINPALVLSYAVSRYIVFVFQYLMCYWLFGASVDTLILTGLITVMYLLITFVPGAILGKLGVRESVSLFLIGSFEDPSVILAASLLIWFLNLFIPALIGGYYLVRTSVNNPEQ